MKILILLILLFAMPLEAATYYVSPTGSGTTCDNGSPCAISRIAVAAQPGDIWMLKNGTYSASGSVLFINGLSGTSGAHIRVTAENPGQATLQGDGSAGHVLRLVDAHYWDFDNFVVRNADNPENTVSNASILGTSNSSYLIFRKMIFADANTYGNNDAVLLQGNTMLIEDSDILRSHRNFLACFPESTYNIIIRRVYVGQPVTDHSSSGPGDGFVFYSCRDSMNENSIAEGLNGYGFTGWGDNNAVRGAIAINNDGGLFNGTSSALGNLGSNFELSGYLGITNSGTCAYFRPSGNYTIDGVSCISNQIVADNDPANGETDFNLTIRNTMVKDTDPSSGFYLGTQNPAFTTKLIEYSQAYNTGGINGGWDTSNTPPNPPGNVDPNIGSCRVFVPTTGAYKAKGLNGADIGANIVYTWQHGLLTTNELWDSSTGKMKYGPPVVAGVNDSSTGLVRDTLGTRLNITSAGCLPAGYGGGPSSLTVTRFQFNQMRSSSTSTIESSRYHLGSENAHVNVMAAGYFALRTKVKCTGGDCSPLAMNLYYRKNETGSYTTIPNSCGSDLAFVGTTNTNADIPAHGTETSEQLTSDLTANVPGEIARTNAAITYLDLGQDSETETEHLLQVCSGVSNGTVFDFRPYKQDGTALDTYTVTPRLTVASARLWR